jgi:hypothetical protein
MSKPTQLNPETSGLDCVGFFSPSRKTCMRYSLLLSSASNTSGFPKKQGRIFMSRFIRHTGFLAGFSLALLAFAERSLAEPATSQPSADNAQPASNANPLGLSSGNIGATIKSLFAPRTEDEYFSPFDIMNPEHIRADMPLRIGGIEDLSLYMGLQTVGRLQALQQQNVYIAGVKQAGLDPGFQDPFANLSFLASIPDKLDVYFDLYIASRPHPNTMYAHEGYLLFKQLPAPFDAGPLGRVFDYVNLKVGAFDLDFGDDNYRRSNNARVQRNPLIGNPVIDPNVEEIGAELYSIKGPIYWLVGVGSGTTTEYFDYGSSPSVHGKIWGYPLPDVRTSISAYHVSLGGTGAGNQNSDLYAAGRSGEPFSSVFGGGDDPGSIQPQGGKDVTAVEGDATWNHWPFEVYSNVGYTQDSDENGSAPGTPAERWLYGTVEPVYHFTPAFYVAARYSFGVANAVHGIETDGWVDRIEVGAGYWVTRSLLTKIEYLYQQYHGFGGDTGEVSGVDASPSPRFNGVVLEVSWSL